MQIAPSTAPTPALKGISSMATRQLLNELLALYAAQGGSVLQLESVGGVDAAKRVQAGEDFDLVFLASDAIDKLILAGHLDASSKVNLADSGVALAVRAGAPQPDISSGEAVRAAVLAAKSLSYSTGPSGVALALEMAYVMAADRTAISIYYVATAGEEQGLLGAAHLARRLKAEGINVLGMLAADCVGNVTSASGAKATTSVRLFSEGVPSQETEAQKKAREALGAENDSPSREFARYLKHFGERYAESLECLVMLRRDRVGRGGDHLAFNKAGFPAARVTETQENFDRQHQVPRIEGGRTYGDSPAFFDPGYCAKITREMVGAFHHLAMAPEAPANVVLHGAMNADGRLTWTPFTDPRIASIVVYRRRADGVTWQEGMVLPPANQAVLTGMGTDNFFFAVATRDKDGFESLPVSPGKVE